ncbi:MAG: ASKHA domain-containing protein [Deltaproteobacteria bacterium]|jgi:uncharacterized 2Fe-2S/4Fe-4S cluster protein (DUF4445 family)|nr:ASKHA domain-containing protein [Deltaproteobacteria bacterium]
MSDEKVMVIFQPSGRRGEVPKGVNIIEASRLLGVDIEALCGEKKVCGKCVVRIEDGHFEKYGITSSMSHVSPWQVEEEKFINVDRKEKGFRLGCMATVEDDILVFVPEESRAGKQVVSKAARDIHIEHNPAVKLYTVQVDKPTFEDPTGDFERICKALEQNYALKDLTIDILTLRELPDALRNGDWMITVSVWNDKEIIRVRPGKVEHAYGLAIDVGTTTVAAYFCDLTTMEVIDTVSMMNPQCKYGEDVMARITFHMTTPGGLKRMSDDIIEGLNELIEKAIQQTFPPTKKKKKKKGEDEDIPDVVEVPEEGKTYLRLTKEDIEDITIGFNTAMHHILLGLNPEYVGLAPFPPVIHHSMDIRARDLGVKVNPSSYMFVLPNEAGFVGADNVGVLIAEAPYKGEENQLIIDIGTNGELVLGNRHKLISSSCATGPALEGAQLAYGMRAAPGAIERINIDPDTKEVDYKVIGRDAWRKFSEPKEMKAKGICGSGILDVLAELYSSGVVTKTGAFNKKALKDHPRFRKNPDTKQPEFVLAWADESSIDKDIVITQKDVRQIQLAKGALYAGCKLMVKRMGLEKVDTVKIAGAFGTHVDRAKALTMGLFPDCEIEMIKGIGNAAGDGCRAALLNVKKRVEANWCSRNVEYVELTVEPTFERDFMEAMQLPHMTDEFPHLRGVVRDEILDQ